MNHQARPVDALSTPSHQHSSSKLLPHPAASFDLGRLACELRILVIRAATSLDAKDCGHLLLVNREFHQVVSPFHWSRIVVDARRPIVELEFLVETILTRYGSTVQEVLLYGAGHTSGQFSSRTEDLIGQAMDKVPHLTSLTCNELMKVVAVSARLDSLTHLSIGVGFKQRAELRDIAAIISRCPQLGDLRMGIQPSTDPSDRSLMVAAVASRPLLTTLILEECDWILDSTVATTQWQCPITRLVILDGDASHLSLPTFRAFVSHFSTTLDELSILAAYESWIDDSTPLDPLSLPLLATLELVAVTGIAAMISLVEIFDTSPLSTLTVVSYEPISRVRMLDLVLIDVAGKHRSTLKRLNVNWHIRSTALYAVLGLTTVELRDCSDKYGRDDDQSEEDSLEEDDRYSDENSYDEEAMEVDGDQSEEESGGGDEDND